MLGIEKYKILSFNPEKLIRNQSYILVISD